MTFDGSFAAGTRAGTKDDGRACLDPFRSERARLRALAYRMTGSVSDAEDLVQDAWLRWSAVDPATVESPRAFLTTLVGRLALDRLRAARAVRERYYGLWLPEPEVAGWDEAAPEADHVPLAMLLLLERLTPEQRAVFVLREAMDLDYAEIAGILGKSVETCRQIMRRARERMGEPARFPVDPAAGRRVAEAFATASERRDYAGIVALLAEDAVLMADGGGKARAAINTIRGSARIGRFFAGLQRKYDGALRLVPVLVNGGPGFIGYFAGAFHSVYALELVDGRIRRILQIANPDKLTRIEA